MLIWPCSGLEPDRDQVRLDCELAAKKVEEIDAITQATIAAADK